MLFETIIIGTAIYELFPQNYGIGCKALEGFPLWATFLI